MLKVFCRCPSYLTTVPEKCKEQRAFPRFGNGNGFVTLGRQQIGGIERGDDFAADHDFLQFVPIPKRVVIQQMEPKVSAIRFRRRALEEGRIEHGAVLKQRTCQRRGG